MPHKDSQKKREYKAEWYQKYRARILTERKINYQRNPIKKIAYQKEYAAGHPEEIRIYRGQYRRRKYKEDPQFRLTSNLRRRMHLAITKGYKSASTQELLGASFEFVKEYLTKLLQPGMTWENYGRDTWHIDHIIPCASFDLTDPKQQKKCFHYTNLQPLEAKKNLSKGAKYAV